jgi:hypothetical protein
MDCALYRFDMVCVLMAHLKYLSLHIFLRYFDHSNRILCVSIESYSKNHVETGKYGYLLVRYGFSSNDAFMLLLCLTTEILSVLDVWKEISCG